MDSINMERSKDWTHSYKIEGIHPRDFIVPTRVKTDETFKDHIRRKRRQPKKLAYESRDEANMMREHLNNLWKGIEKERQTSLVQWHIDSIDLQKEVFEDKKKLECSFAKDDESISHGNSMNSLNKLKPLPSIQPKQKIRKELIDHLPILMRPRPKYDISYNMSRNQRTKLNAQNYHKMLHNVTFKREETKQDLTRQSTREFDEDDVNVEKYRILQCPTVRTQQNFILWRMKTDPNIRLNRELAERLNVLKRHEEIYSDVESDGSDSDYDGSSMMTSRSVPMLSSPVPGGYSRKQELTLPKIREEKHAISDNFSSPLYLSKSTESVDTVGVTYNKNKVLKRKRKSVAHKKHQNNNILVPKSHSTPRIQVETDEDKTENIEGTTNVSVKQENLLQPPFVQSMESISANSTISESASNITGITARELKILREITEEHLASKKGGSDTERSTKERLKSDSMIRLLEERAPKNPTLDDLTDAEIRRKIIKEYLDKKEKQKGGISYIKVKMPQVIIEATKDIPDKTKLERLKNKTEKVKKSQAGYSKDVEKILAVITAMDEKQKQRDDAVIKAYNLSPRKVVDKVEDATQEKKKKIKERRTSVISEPPESSKADRDNDESNEQ